MSNDTTQNLPNGPSFEERVFARFDALDNSTARVESGQERIEGRLEKIEERQERLEEGQQKLEAGQQKLEARQQRMDARQERMEERQDRLETRLGGIDQRLEALESKAYDTRPIWERALAEILELRENVHTLDRKFNILTRDSVTLRSDLSRLEDRMDKRDAERA